jgi:hypothetical protein
MGRLQKVEGLDAFFLPANRRKSNQQNSVGRLLGRSWGDSGAVAPYPVGENEY